MGPRTRQILHLTVALLVVVTVAGCAIAKPRTDDPWQSFNRKSYAFNQAVDAVAIRPAAVTYRKITTPPLRKHINNFFDNIQLPVTIANDLLQARPARALKTSGRFLVNLTLGFLGFFDPASRFGIPEDNNDFGVTLARWGVPDGPYLVLPLIGPTTTRDIWQMPVDGYFFDPLSIYAANHDFPHEQQYLPQLIYLISLRARVMDAEGFLQSAYDPYVFRRDAYRQRRLYKIYYGNPPDDVIERMQGLDQDNFDPEELLQQQHAWEKKNKDQPATAASAKPAPMPAAASSSGL